MRPAVVVHEADYNAGYAAGWLAKDRPLTELLDVVNTTWQTSAAAHADACQIARSSAVQGYSRPSHDLSIKASLEAIVRLLEGNKPLMGPVSVRMLCHGKAAIGQM